MFLKKSGHIFIALLLLVSTLGVTFNMHYCHGDLRSIKIFKVDPPCCTVPNCCETQTISVRLNDDYVAQQQFDFKKLEVSKVVMTIAILVPQQEVDYSKLPTGLYLERAVLSSVDIPVMHQSFLI